MKRVVWVVVGLVLLFSCRSEERELSKEEYEEVMEEVREELIPRLIGRSIRIPVPRLDGKWQWTSFRFRKQQLWFLHQLALAPCTVERITITSAIKVCRDNEVSFQDLNDAHADYGLLGMSYKDEVSELLSILRGFKPEVKVIMKREAIPPNPDWAIYMEKWKRIILSELDPNQLERATWLTYDLGLNENNPGLVVRLDNTGTYTLRNELIELGGKILPLAAKDPYALVHIIPDPELPAGMLFDALDTIKECGAQRVAASSRLSSPLLLKDLRLRQFRPSMEDTSDYVFIEILKDDQVKIDSKLAEGSLDSTIAAAMARVKSKTVVMIVSDSTSCGRLIEVGNAARRSCNAIEFVREGRLPLKKVRRGGCI